ncbi:hypothetical protein PC116_g31653 [Phytophthora cactorum]|nr:hypothetical protein PC116_g31653 [Phytophthora cactorum]
MQHAAADRDDSSDCSLCRTVGLVRVWNRGLLLDAFVFVEGLERVGSELTSSVMPNKHDLLAELRLHLHDVRLDAVFALRLGTQTETLHASAGFVHDQQQVLAAAKRVFLHGSADVEVEQLERVVVTLVTVAGERFLDHLALLTTATHACSTRLGGCFRVLDHLGVDHLAKHLDWSVTHTRMQVDRSSTCRCIRRSLRRAKPVEAIHEIRRRHH